MTAAEKAWLNNLLQETTALIEDVYDRDFVNDIPLSNIRALLNDIQQELEDIV